MTREDWKARLLRPKCDLTGYIAVVMFNPAVDALHQLRDRMLRVPMSCAQFQALLYPSRVAVNCRSGAVWNTCCWLQGVGDNQVPPRPQVRPASFAGEACSYFLMERNGRFVSMVDAGEYILQSVIH